jgi:hypothetical protein
MTSKPSTQRQHDESRLDLARRLTKAENIPFEAAVRRIPNDPSKIRELIARLNDQDATRAREVALN